MRTDKTKTTQKLPYTPPKVTFVPLKLEERLLACLKVYDHPASCPGGPIAAS